MDDIQRAIEMLENMRVEHFYRYPALNEAVQTAISAMQELQQYRATRLTPHMVETLKENDKRSHQLAVRYATELDEYRAIGTPEECREAREKQRARKPLLF